MTDDCADTVGIDGRMAGLELRDTLLVLRPGPRVGFVLLFRKRLSESGVVGQVLATGTGGINIEACRVRRNATATKRRWPSNVVIVHDRDCRPDFVRGLLPEESCASTCAALLLDRLSGDLGTHGGGSRGAGGQHGMFRPLPAQPGITTGYGDAGGASRSYPQFADEDGLRNWLRQLVCDQAQSSC